MTGSRLVAEGCTTFFVATVAEGIPATFKITAQAGVVGTACDLADVIDVSGNCA